MRHFTIARPLLIAGSLLWASTDFPAAASEAFSDDGTNATHSAHTILTVLPSNMSEGFLLVQGRGGRGGGHSGGSSGSRQTFHSGGHHHGSHHHGSHNGHHHHGHYRHSYPYYYRYPYSSSYSPGYSYGYSSPSYSSPIPPTSGPEPFLDGDASEASGLTTNPLPPTVAEPATIQILNPPENRVPLSYRLNGTTATLQPGQTSDLQNDRPWVIEFDRGGQFGTARYSLEPGAYTFTATDKGWELFHQPSSTVEQSTPPGEPFTPPSTGPLPFPSGSEQPSPFGGNLPSSSFSSGGLPSR